MAKLALIYGMRLFPAEDLAEVREATLTLKDGRTARITMHLLEGSLEDIGHEVLGDLVVAHAALDVGVNAREELAILLGELLHRGGV